ncbi:MAG TPA: dihydroorotase [Chitinophagaceae bacterium]
MTILVRKAHIVDPHSPFNNTVNDILVRDGVITEIGASINTKADKVVEPANCFASAGWIDLFADFCDPGYEYRETLESGANAAVAGGYTRVCVIPNTQPVIDSKGQVEYITRSSAELPAAVLPLGAATKQCAGKELAEMYDMKASGAVAFTDALNPVQSPGLLLKALQYVKAFDGTIIQLPDDKTLSAHGLMHEGVISTRLGLPGIPAIAEELMVKRDIDLVRYTGSRLHLTGVSTRSSMELIRAAKAEGLNITVSVTPYHLVFSDEDLVHYDTNLKVSPPLRSKADVQALREAVSDGTVDCIASHHRPQHRDNKDCEFEYAKEGMTGIQTAFSVVNTALPGLPVERLVQLFGENAAKILGQPAARIDKGAPAEFTLFSRDTEWTVNAGELKSRSKNTPFAGSRLKGRVVAVINKGKLFLN